MSVTHDIKRSETPMQKLQEKSYYFSYAKKLCSGRAFCVLRAVQFVTNGAVPFHF
jgi:hypothetical protein